MFGLSEICGVETFITKQLGDFTVADLRSAARVTPFVYPLLVLNLWQSGKDQLKLYFC